MIIWKWLKTDKKFKLKNVIFNKNEYNTLERELIELLKRPKVKFS